MNKEKYLPSTLKNDENFSVKELAKTLCTCHHKCNDTTDCVVEDEALLLINENKSNNFDVKSNKVVIANSATTKEKQIEEMAKDLSELSCTNKCKNCKHFYNQYEVSCVDMNFAETLYNAGYRKQSEGEWISNHQTDEFICNLCGAITPVDCEKERFYKSNFCPNCGARMRGENNG